MSENFAVRQQSEDPDETARWEAAKRPDHGKHPDQALPDQDAGRRETPEAVGGDG